MPYYPFLNAPDCDTWVTLYNYPPNNWELSEKSEMYVNLTWRKGDIWHTETLKCLGYGDELTIKRSELPNVPLDELALLSLSKNVLPRQSDMLPVFSHKTTKVPIWRATIGLSNNHASVSYQGEVEPFPAPGSLLTFSPFNQVGDEVENFLLFLNVENYAKTRISEIEIYTPDGVIKKGTFSVRNNCVTVIPLNNYDFSETDLPLTICRDMSAIPLYFTRTKDGHYLSLEHTHPPASYVVHGRRFEVQRYLKKIWFSKTGEL